MTESHEEAEAKLRTDDVPTEIAVRVLHELGTDDFVQALRDLVVRRLNVDPDSRGAMEAILAPDRTDEYAELIQCQSATIAKLRAEVEALRARMVEQDTSRLLALDELDALVDEHCKDASFAMAYGAAWEELYRKHGGDPES